MSLLSCPLLLLLLRPAKHVASGYLLLALALSLVVASIGASERHAAHGSSVKAPITPRFVTRGSCMMGIRMSALLPKSPQSRSALHSLRAKSTTKGSQQQATYGSR